jgi:hypothetical protein
MQFGINSIIKIRFNLIFFGIKRFATVTQDLSSIPKSALWSGAPLPDKMSLIPGLFSSLSLVRALFLRSSSSDPALVFNGPPAFGMWEALFAAQRQNKNQNVF